LRAAANIALPVSLAVATAVLPSIASAADLNLIPDGRLVLINVVVFGLLIYPVNRLLITPLLRVVEAREQKTAGSLDDAARLEADATSVRAELEAQLAAARARAQARRAAIMADAEAQERSLLEAASSDAARTIESVRESIAADLAAARTALQNDARALAGEAASRLLGRPL
jgi:F0F1-type ATP synthase membrane subunit b/b'